MRLVGRHDGREIALEIERHGASYRVRLDERWIEADLVPAGSVSYSLRLADGTQFSLLHQSEGAEHRITIGTSRIDVEIIDPLALKRKGRDDESGTGGIIRAMMPGRIVRVLVQPGDTVRKGTALVILEAMKMENEINAPAEGVVDTLFVEAGQTVESGAELVHIS